MEISIHSHKFEKNNLITIVRGKRVYDKMKCTICGLEGTRQGLSDIVVVKRDKKCIKDTCEKVMIIGDYVCAEFGFEKGKIYDKVACPDAEKEKYGKDTWVFSKKRGEPVRLLPVEYRPMPDKL
jgi:hypothetical protein